MKPRPAIILSKIPGGSFGAYLNGVIVLDPTKRGQQEFLDSAIHEALHHADSRMSEWRVRRHAAIITDVLWRLNYRRKAKA